MSRRLKIAPPPPEAPPTLNLRAVEAELSRTYAALYVLREAHGGNLDLETSMPDVKTRMPGGVEMRQGDLLDWIDYMCFDAIESGLRDLLAALGGRTQTGSLVLTPEPKRGRKGGKLMLAAIYARKSTEGGPSTCP